MRQCKTEIFAPLRFPMKITIKKIIFVIFFLTFSNQKMRIHCFVTNLTTLFLLKFITHGAAFEMWETVENITTSIVNGENSIPGRYPYYTAIIIRVGTTDMFYCGG